MAESLKKYCRTCGIPFAFLITKNGKQIPIEWDSMEEDEKQSILFGIPIHQRTGIKEDNSSPLHVPHFHKKEKRPWEF